MRATALRPRLRISRGLQPVFKDGQVIKEGKYITAGNASPAFRWASAAVVMEAKEAEKRGLAPLGRYIGVTAAGCEPDEMGIGPIYAVPKLLKAHGLSIDDIGLWELNEAFASQVLQSARVLGIPMRKISTSMAGRFPLATPMACRAQRMVGHALIEGKRAWREIRGLHHVRGRRHGGRAGPVRGSLNRSNEHSARR